MTIKKFLITAVLLMTGLMMTGCAGMAISQGDDALKMKRYYDAARSYITALSYDANNKDVKVKLANIAQPAYDEKLATAQSSENTGDIEQAYGHYAGLATLIDNLNKYIGIDFPVVNARQKMLELGNRISAGYYKTAEVSFRNEDYYSAIEKYKKALAYTNPYRDSTEKIAESYYRMGKNYSYRGDYRQAAENFEKASQVISNYRDSKRLAANNIAMANENDARVHYTNALDLGGQGRYREAIKEFQVSLTYVPHYKNSEELIGQYTRLMNEKDAKDHYQQGLELGSGGKYAEAIAELKQASLSIPHYKNIDDLIISYTNMMNEKEAKDHYERGLELMASEHYKEAKEEFKQVLSLLPEYKNAKSYADTCQRKLDEAAAPKNKDNAAKDNKDKKGRED